jgi:hypothetical protein
MLYDIVRKKSARVAIVCRSNLLNVSFRRHITGNNLITWQMIMAMVSAVQLIGQNDMFSWSPQVNGKFSVHSMYRV